MADDEEPVEGITLIGREFTVNAQETLSTGEYESYKPQVTIKGEIPAAMYLTPRNRKDLKEQLLKLHGDAQAVLSRACGNKIAEPEWETWTFEEEGPGERKDDDDGE